MLNLRGNAKRAFAWGLFSLSVLAMVPPAVTAQGNKPGGIEVGVVVPKDLAPGEHASGTVVLNPSAYASIPGLKVTTLELPQKGGSPAALSNFQLQINGAPAQPAGQPFRFIAGDKLDIRIKLPGVSDFKPFPLSLPLSGLKLKLPLDFSAPPISQLGSLALIRGPFGGDWSKTLLNINGDRAPLIAESQHLLFYNLPETVKPGPAEIELQEGDRHSRLKTWVLGLEMSADQLKLIKGESTAFHVVITGADTVPPEAWSGAGQIPELVDPEIIRRFKPDFQPPGPSTPGFLLLTIENVSPAVVTMGHGERVLLEFNRTSTNLRYDGTVTSKMAGGFAVNAMLIPFLHEQAPENIGQTDGTTPEIPKTPTPTPPTNTTPSHKDERKEDCPQRGKGCVALVIDFSRDYTFEFDMATVAENLGKAGCDTDYVTPKFKKVPTPSLFSTPTAAEIKAAQDHNQAQWDSINSAIARHREKVARGVEVAIEITNGHGGESGAGLPCGDVEPSDWFGSYLRRDDFHQGNYQAANKNVCSWFAADLSCYGGLTPKVVDELENLTTATCHAASTIACPNHAGWEADGAMSSATSTETCSNGSVWWQGGYVKNALEQEIKRREAGQNSDYSALIQQLHSATVESTTARYTDRGYAKDKPPSHGRGGYGESSSNPH